MNGSAKQIIWAEEIQSKMVVQIENMRRQFANDCTAHCVDSDDLEYKNAMAIFSQAIAVIRSKSDARWFIDNRQTAITRQFVKGLAK